MIQSSSDEIIKPRLDDHLCYCDACWYIPPFNELLERLEIIQYNAHFWFGNTKGSCGTQYTRNVCDSLTISSMKKVKR